MTTDMCAFKSDLPSCQAGASIELVGSGIETLKMCAVTFLQKRSNKGRRGQYTSTVRYFKLKNVDLKSQPDRNVKWRFLSSEH